MALSLRWQQLWSLSSLHGAGDQSFGAIQTRYTEPHRAYHTLQHLAECLCFFDAARTLMQRPDEVELALWFHDVIYDTRRSDNEEASAQWAQQLLLEVGAPPATTQRVGDLIRLTNHVAEPQDGDGMLLLDIDLAILGAEPARFDEYERQVRQEYRWVAWPAFCMGRTKILRNFLQRPTIYRTGFFQTRFEAQARTNLAASLDNLVGFMQDAK
jgi:predicted metal-dependent HD superfamily phosphohydrolase